MDTAAVKEAMNAAPAQNNALSPEPIASMMTAAASLLEDALIDALESLDLTPDGVTILALLASGAGSGHSAECLAERAGLPAQAVRHSLNDLLFQGFAVTDAAGIAAISEAGAAALAAARVLEGSIITARYSGPPSLLRAELARIITALDAPPHGYGRPESWA
jgi:hypothetical protein